MRATTTILASMAFGAAFAAFTRAEEARSVEPYEGNGGGNACVMNMKNFCGHEMEEFQTLLELAEIPELIGATKRLSKCFERHTSDLEPYCTFANANAPSEVAVTYVSEESDPCDDLVNQLCGSQIKKLESILLSGGSPQDIVRGCSDLISCLIKNDEKIRTVCHEEARMAYLMEIAVDSPYAKNIQSCVASSSQACPTEYSNLLLDIQLPRKRHQGGMEADDDELERPRSHFIDRVRNWLNYLQCVADHTHDAMKGDACLKNVLVLSLRAGVESAHHGCDKKKEEPASVRAMKGEIVERQFYREMQHPEMLHPKMMGAWMLIPFFLIIAVFFTGCLCGRCCARRKMQLGGLRERCCRRSRQTTDDDSVAIGEEVPTSVYKDLKTDQAQVVKLV